ncbi:MAG TPA: hypothetical protein VGO50_19525 [Pyrinomonadaceae bacterium]|jgi:hypothetical protein|nr:hypothetical protein [Pyrinomonadaceae bacterium]
MFHLRLIDTSIKSFFLLFYIAIFISSASSQVFVPINKVNPQSSSNNPKIDVVTNKDVGAKLMSILSENGEKMSALAADISPSSPSLAPNAFPVCDSPPTLQQIGANTEYNQTLMSTTAALKAGLPFLKLEGSLNQMVLIRDYTRSAACLASDNATTMKYGQTIRMIITIANYSAQGDLSLPVVAANATINNKNNRVNIVVYGLSNPGINTIIGNLASKELNVESYGDFTKATSELIALIDKSDTVKTVERLGIIPNVAVPTDYKVGVVMGFALTQITKGKSCLEAKTAFKSPTDPISKAIDDTYAFIIGGCDSTKPSDRNKLDARDQLLNLKVDY